LNSSFPYQPSLTRLRASLGLFPARNRLLYRADGAILPGG